MWMISQEPLVSVSPSPIPINLKTKVSHGCSSSFAAVCFWRLLVCLDGFTKELMMHSEVSKDCTQMWQWLNLLCTQPAWSWIKSNRSWPVFVVRIKSSRMYSKWPMTLLKICSGVLSRLDDTAASVPWRRNRDVKCMCWKGPIWSPPGRWEVKGIWTLLGNRIRALSWVVTPMLLCTKKEKKSSWNEIHQFQKMKAIWHRWLPLSETNWTIALRENSEMMLQFSKVAWCEL